MPSFPSGDRFKIRPNGHASALGATSIWPFFTLFALALFALLGRVAFAERLTSKPPTAADWAALGKLPDFTGVWLVDLGARAFDTSGIVLTPAYEKKRKAAVGREDATGNCVPPGEPSNMVIPFPLEFLLTPGMVTIIQEVYMQPRHIYTDGRALPSSPGPSYNGTSIGHWEADTLIAETVGFMPDTSLTFLKFTPHGGKMRMTERFHLSGPDVMSITTTIEDPEALQKPWVFSRFIRRHREYTIEEYVCAENNRNAVRDDGSGSIDLTPPASLRRGGK